MVVKSTLTVHAYAKSICFDKYMYLKSIYISRTERFTENRNCQKAHVQALITLNPFALRKAKLIYNLAFLSAIGLEAKTKNS